MAKVFGHRVDKNISPKDIDPNINLWANHQSVGDKDLSQQTATRVRRLFSVQPTLIPRGWIQ